ncbi:MAG TPA: SUMF1/EgtB/PvdO family nonheme iron enzyme [Rhizomicrobium sp.]|jgi:formylglycine-generating enzyme required for sulfatase activity
MATETERDGNALRVEKNLPPFSFDIFISWRNGSGTDSKAAALKTFLEDSIPDVKIQFFSEAIANLDKIQRADVEASRVVIFLLESGGLHNGNAWGQQYKELLAVAEFETKVEFEFSEDEATLVRALPVAVYFGPPDENGSKEAIMDRLLPEKKIEGRPVAQRGVRKLFMNTAWKPALERDPLGLHPQWHRDVLMAIHGHCKRYGIQFGNGKIPGIAEKAGPQNAAEPADTDHFDPIAYLGRCKRFWERGHTFVVGQRESDTDQGYSEVGADFRIKLPCLSEKPGSPQYDVVSDIDILLKTDNSLWVLGQPGAGKTTAITQAAAEEAAAAREFFRGLGDAQRCPLVFSFKRLRERLRQCHMPDDGSVAISLHELLSSEIDAQGISCSAAEIDQFLRDNKCSLYLDGFDEISQDEQRLMVNLIDAVRGSWKEGTRLVVSCRSGHEARAQWNFERLSLLALTGVEFDEFAKRRKFFASHGSRRETQMFNRNHEALRRAFEESGRESGLLRTPLFLGLLLKANLGRQDITGNGQMMYVKVFSGLFQHIVDSARTRFHEEEFDPLPALTQLAKISVLEGREIDEESLADSVRGGLGRLPQHVAHAAREKRVEFLTMDATVLEPSSDGTGTYAFSHALFAEYLVAADIAAAWSRSAGTSSRAARTKQQQAVLSQIFNGQTSRAQSRAAELVDRVVCIIFDKPVDHGDVLKGEEVSRLAKEFCVSVAAMVGTAQIGQDLRSAKPFIALIRGVQGARSALEPSDRRECLDALRSIYRTRQSSWPPAERETALDAIAMLDEEWWRTIAQASEEPIAFAAARVRVPCWPNLRAREVAVPAFKLARKPVLVREYQMFCDDPDRYDHRFWPLRPAADQPFFEEKLIDLLKRGKIDHIFESVPSRHCVVSDVPETNARIYQHWREQTQRPFHPVTNVTWIESVAYARWLSWKDKRDWQILGQAEWSAAVAAIRAAEVSIAPSPGSAPQRNVRAAGVHAPSTIGVFPPNALGLVDFGSNVSVWLSEADSGGMTVWPSQGKLDGAFHVGPSYLSPPSAAQLEVSPQMEEIDERCGYVGIWLAEAV